MRRAVFISFAAIVVAIAIIRFAVAADEQSAVNTLTDQEKKDGWKLLFDGRTTEGWRGYRMKEVPPGWKVIDGVLTRVAGGAGGKGAGGGDDIVTLDQYDNFELKLQWRVGKGNNSGILYRCTEDAVTSWHTAPEMQVLDNTGWHDKNRFHQAGALYDLYAASKDVVREHGKWNEVKIVANGNHVEHWLNGEKVVEYEWNSDDWKQRVAKSKFKDLPTFAKAAKGHICLQDHSGKVEYRDIKIRPLKKE
jgi:hypothetical protein